MVQEKFDDAKTEMLLAKAYLKEAFGPREGNPEYYRRSIRLVRQLRRRKKELKHG